MPTRRRVVERAVAADPALAAELAAYQRRRRALIARDRAAPSPDVKARLIASVGGGRFERVRAPDRQAVRRHGRPRARAARADRAPGVVGVRAPGHRARPLRGRSGRARPRTAASSASRRAVVPVAHAPGEEVVDHPARARCADNDGRILRPGDELVQRAGHRARPHVPQVTRTCIFAARAFEGIEIAGVRQR